MELTINDEKMTKEKRDLFYEIILEAIEEVALAKAIVEGRREQFVSEDSILGMLEG